MIKVMFIIIIIIDYDQWSWFWWHFTDPNVVAPFSLASGSTRVWKSARIFSLVRSIISTIPTGQVPRLTWSNVTSKKKVGELNDIKISLLPIFKDCPYYPILPSTKKEAVSPTIEMCGLGILECLLAQMGPCVDKSQINIIGPTKKNYFN